MKLVIELMQGMAEPIVIIKASEVTDEVQRIAKYVQGDMQQEIAAHKDGKVFLLDFEDVESIYTENRKVRLRTVNQTVYDVKQRLHTLEDMLPIGFVRVSGAEVVNRKQIQKLDLSFAGTIQLFFKSSSSTFVSRRYVGTVKNKLNLGGKK